jgi:hypothetical protein
VIVAVVVEAKREDRDVNRIMLVANLPEEKANVALQQLEVLATPVQGTHLDRGDRIKGNLHRDFVVRAPSCRGPEQRLHEEGGALLDANGPVILARL